MKTVYYDWVSFSVLCSNPSHLVLCSYLEAMELSGDMPRCYYRKRCMFYIISECNQILNVFPVLRVSSAAKVMFLAEKRRKKLLHEKKINFQLNFLTFQLTDFFANFNYKFSHVYYTLHFLAFYLSFSNISVFFISLTKFLVLCFNKIIIIILIITSEVTSFVIFFWFLTFVEWFFVCLIYSCQCVLRTLNDC